MKRSPCIDGYPQREECEYIAAPQNKRVQFNTFLHYSEPDTRERTVFGSPKPGLFYNYSDRLYGDEWTKGIELAALKAKPDTAAFFEIALNHFHNTNTVNLQHVILGLNRSSGYSYLIFGYTY